MGLKWLLPCNEIAKCAVFVKQKTWKRHLIIFLDIIYFINLSLCCYFITQRPKWIAKYNLRSILQLNPSSFDFCRINLTLFYTKKFYTGNLFRSRTTTQISSNAETYTDWPRNERLRVFQKDIESCSDLYRRMS